MGVGSHIATFRGCFAFVRQINDDRGMRSGGLDQIPRCRGAGYGNFQRPDALSLHAPTGKTGSRRAPFQGARAAKSRCSASHGGVSRSDSARSRAHRGAEAATPRPRRAERTERSTVRLSALRQSTDVVCRHPTDQPMSVYTHQLCAGRRTMTNEAARGERLQIMLSEEELEVLDTFRFKMRMPTRASAIRELLKRGIAAEGFQGAAFGTKSEDFGVVGETPRAASHNASPNNASVQLSTDFLCRPNRSSAMRITSKITATDQPISSRPLSDVIGPIRRLPSIGKASP